MVFRLLGLLGLALLLGVSAPADAVEVHVVAVTDDGFEPAELSIQKGDIVQWEWESGSHTITSGLGPEDEKAGEMFNLALSDQAQVQTFEFTDVGAFPYFSQTAPDGAKGVITVSDSTPVDAKTWGWLKRAFEQGGPGVR